MYKDVFVDCEGKNINLNDNTLMSAITKAEKGSSLDKNYCYMCMRHGVMTRQQYNEIEHKYLNADRD